jgi:DNA processing protein
VFAEASGTNRQIQRGEAALATSAADVLGAIAPQLDPPADLPAAPSEPTPPLNRVEQRLVDVLTPEPRPLDVVCAEADVDAATALVYLLQLEFRGVVRQLQGKQFARA